MPPAAFDSSGRPLELGVRLGRGGEGEVFEVARQPSVAAKLLHAGRTQGKAEKLEAMVRSPPAGAYDLIDGYPVLTWPRGLLYTSPPSTGRGAGLRGYTMARMRPADFVPFYQLTTAARRRQLGVDLTWDRMVLLALRLCHVVRTLHRFGYAVGDLNDRNVLVSRRLTPLLMDTDSFQVPKPGRGHYPSIVGDAQYWPPELLDVDLTRHTGSRVEGDRHALGVLLFQLMMDGYRPYQATGSAVAGLETLLEKTKAGHFPWATPRRGILEPPASAPSYAALPKSIRRLFDRCFVDGHRRPAKRPTADDWYNALRDLQVEGFRPCARDARHRHGAHERACPWCGDANDRFAPRRPKQGTRGTRGNRPGVPGLPGTPVVARRPPARPASKPRGKRGPPQRPLAPPPVVTLVAKPAPPPAPKAAKPRARQAGRRPAAKVRSQARRQARRKRVRWMAYSLMAFATGLLAVTAL